jgi:hypothetical protein
MNSIYYKKQRDSMLAPEKYFIRGVKAEMEIGNKWMNGVMSAVDC